MSEENVQIVRGMWAAFLRGDPEEALSAFHSDVEWDGRNLPDGRVSRGHDAVREHVERWASIWESWEVDSSQFIDAGDAVVVVFSEQGRSEVGIEMAERHAEVYTVRGGKIVRRRGFVDANQALEAAGLRQ
jgi:ketosteroid isomerase-like protein